MRIAFILEEFPSLSQTFVLNQITELLEQGHEIDIFANKAKQQPKVQPDVLKYNLLDRTIYWNIPVKSYRYLFFLPAFLDAITRAPFIAINSVNPFKLGKKAFSLRVFYIANILTKNKNFKRDYDVIYCHFGSNGVIGMYLRNIGAIRGKLVTVFHGIDLSLELNLFGSNIYNKLFHCGDLFLPISDRWKRKLIELGCPKEKIKVHRMGIDLSRFQSIKYIRSKSANKIELLSICRLVSKKGMSYSIQSVASLIKNYPQIQYKIIGDGEEKEVLENLIKKLNAQENIHLIGWKEQDEILGFFQTADIFIAPSVTSDLGDEEGIPMVLMEAMAMKVPIVSTYHSGIPELVKNQETGLLVPERSITELANSIEKLINNPEVCSEMGLLGKNFIDSNHNIHKLSKKLENLFNEIT